MLACAVTIVGLELLYRRTLIGHAFLAIAEDNYAARALGLPERSSAHGELCARRRDRRAGGLCRRRDAARLLRQCADADLLRLRARSRSAAWATTAAPWSRGLLLGLFQQAANFLVGGIFASVAVFAVFIIVLLARPEGLAGAALPATRMMDTQATPVAPEPRGRARLASAFSAALPFLVLLVVGLALPLFGGGYWGVIATRACIYWVLVVGPQPGGRASPARSRSAGWRC